MLGSSIGNSLVEGVKMSNTIMLLLIGITYKIESTLQSYYNQPY